MEEYNNFDLGEQWMSHTIFTADGPIPAWALFLGGMKKDDIRNMLNSLPDNNAKNSLLEARQDAGELLTALNTTSNRATQLLINHGEKAYLQGNREPWAVYAHIQVKQFRGGCLKYIAIIVVIVLFYLLFK